MRISILMLAALTAVAHADPPGLTPVIAPLPPPPAATTSYSGTVLLVDAASFGSFCYGLTDEHGDRGERFIPFGVIGYAFGGPVVHLVKKRPGAALASLTFRIAMPIAGAFVGDALAPPCYGGENCGTDYAAVGALAGAIGAAALDAFYVAKVDAPKREEPVIQPTGGAMAGGFALGVAGSF